MESRLDLDDRETGRHSISLASRLQTFGIKYGHRFSPIVRENLVRELYHDIVDALEYDPFFGDTPIDFKKPLSTQHGYVDGAEYSESARGRPCGHVFRKGETLYRCRNCGIDDTCVLCQKCYKASDHEGHDVAMSLNGGSGGCCDCGDKEAWRTEIKCRYHYTSGKRAEVREVDVNPAIERVIRNTVATALDFAIDILVHSKNSAKAPSLRDSTNPTIDAHLATLTGPAYDHKIEAELVYSWSTVLWNDEKHDFDEVIDIVKRSCKATKAYGKEIATLVDRRGRATVYTGNLEEAIRVAEQLGRIKLGVTVRSSRDIFREDMVEVIIFLLQDLANLSVTTTGGQRNSQAVRRIICEEMCSPWRRGIGPLQSDPHIKGEHVPMLDSDDDADEDGIDDDTNMIGNLHCPVLADGKLTSQISKKLMKTMQPL